VTREYVKLRYRLLPYLYSLAHAARFSGRPLLSGVDPADRDAPSWARDAEFLLGDSLLFSPITMPMVREPAERTPYRFDPPLQRRVWIDRQLDEQSYSTRKRPDVEPRELGYDHEIRINSFNGSEKSVAWGRRYLVVWDGTFVAHRPGWYRFRVIGNGRKELCLDDAEHPQIRTNFDGGTNEAVLELTEGEHPISISFLHQGGGLPVIEVAVSVVEEPVLQSEVATERPAVKSPVWLPKGTWRDLYTGTVHHGRSVVSRVFGIEELPAFVRCGSIVPLAPVVSHTTTAFWTNLSLEVFPHVADGDMATTVYFDDGRSEAYQSGEVATVTAAMERDGSHITIDIGDLVAPSNTPAQSDVDLSVRIHLLPGENLERATINGHDSTPLACTPTEPRLPPLPVSDEQMVFDNAETVAFNGLRPGSRIVLTL
jgi:alpha-D-xyloside xylohydrolase